MKCSNHHSAVIIVEFTNKQEYHISLIENGRYIKSLSLYIRVLPNFVKLLFCFDLDSTCPRAVVVETVHAVLTTATVFRAWRPIHITRFAIFVAVQTGGYCTDR